MKRNCFLFILAALMVAMLAGCSNENADKNQINIKIGTVASENAPVSKALLKMKEELEEKSNGRFYVQIYFGGQLGGEQEMLELTRVGDIEMVTSQHLNVSGTIGTLAALESYFMFDDYDHAFRFMDSPGGQKMLDAYQRMDLQGMGFFPTGFRQFTNNKRPIETVEDLKGLKIRGYSPVQIAAWEALGLNLTAVCCCGECFGYVSVYCRLPGRNYYRHCTVRLFLLCCQKAEVLSQRSPPLYWKRDLENFCGCYPFFADSSSCVGQHLWRYLHPHRSCGLCLLCWNYHQLLRL